MDVDHKESWVPKNWCFWTVVWRRFLRVPWTARRSNQSILKEISPGYSLEGLMLKLKNTLATWCEELTHLKRSWCWERLKAGGEGDDRGWDGWMASLTQRTWVWVNSGSCWWTGKPGMLQSMVSQRVGHNWATELNWTGLSWQNVCMKGAAMVAAMAATQQDSTHQGWSSYWRCQMFNLSAVEITAVHCVFTQYPPFKKNQDPPDGNLSILGPFTPNGAVITIYLDQHWHVMGIDFASPACRASAWWLYECLQSVRFTWHWIGPQYFMAKRVKQWAHRHGVHWPCHVLGKMLAW